MKAFHRDWPPGIHMSLHVTVSDQRSTSPVGPADADFQLPMSFNVRMGPQVVVIVRDR